LLMDRRSSAIRGVPALVVSRERDSGRRHTASTMAHHREPVQTSERGPRVALDRRVAGLFVLVFIGAAYYLIFRLPFRFPPARKISSSSVVFGFNNSVAIGGVLVLTAAATLFLLWRRREARGTLAETLWLRVEQTPPAERIRPGVLALMVLAHALLTLAMWVKAQTSAAWLIDFEASHFLWRLRLMEVFHARPYLDFQHEYGPALLYLPMFLHRALLPMGLSLEASYYLSYFVCSVLGVWMILLLLNQTVLPRGRKEIAFCLLGAAGLVPYMGLNGNVVRYLPPYVSVVVAHRLMSRPGGAAWTILAVAALGSLNVLISPEIGVAFVVGWVAYCLFTAVIDPRRAMVAGGGLLLALLLTALRLPRQDAGSVVRLTGGANHLPLLPA